MAHSRKKPTAEDGKIALREHVLARALAARARYGDEISHETLIRILEDREVVRHPTTIDFECSALQPGEFAFAEQLGDLPADGFRIHVHPTFRERADVLPLLVAYHLVCVNYGEIVTHEEAELFGATLLGLDVETYYETLCRLADEIA